MSQLDGIFYLISIIFFYKNNYLKLIIHNLTVIIN